MEKKTATTVKPKPKAKPKAKPRAVKAEPKKTASQRQEERREELKKALIELLPMKAYHVGKACKELGIGRRTYYNWMEEDEDFADQIDEVFAYDVDDSEERLRLLRQGIPKMEKDKETGVLKFKGWIEKPHFGALVVHLQAKAKDRGYGRQIQIDDTRKRETDSMTDKELYDEMKRLEELYGKDAD